MAEDEAERAFRELAEELSDEGAEASVMFGMPTWKVRGKAFGGLPRGDEGLVFKLPAAAVEEALTLDGVHHFDPAMGRPMKEWVVVPSVHADRWPALARQALGYVSSATKERKAKR